MPTLIDLSHTIFDGLITYKGLPAPIICDYPGKEYLKQIKLGSQRDAVWVDAQSCGDACLRLSVRTQTGGGSCVTYRLVGELPF